MKLRAPGQSHGCHAAAHAGAANQRAQQFAAHVVDGRRPALGFQWPGANAGFRSIEHVGGAQ